MVRKITRNIVAAACLAVGIAGLFLPFIQGIAMIILAIVIADFDAKERILERYRHTRLGSHLWRHHEKRKERELARANSLVPESAPPPPATGEAASDTK